MDRPDRYENGVRDGKKQLADKILFFMDTVSGYTAKDMLSIIKQELEEVRRENAYEVQSWR